ncbi:hypothetical protein [Variovorax sp. DXTD-1]|uniref:hypothetical protein n=1 Tax=Variovorax sp. DXTD-1 TaxID=2495592 RepID=UPI000F866B98|nr:hypothetical protein [Variovorax sp. DXTD-1]RST52512.1 hypothetical protein EJI00_06820 [Variovorax sp. DXTD-1]
MDAANRLQFDGRNPALKGYFSLIAPAFQEFCIDDFKIGDLHMLAAASGDRLAHALEICSRIENALDSRPEAWRVYLGSIKRPGSPEVPLQPLIIRRKAIQIVRAVTRMLAIARRNSAEVVFGGGTFYWPLSGIKLKPGEEY